jgi:hypothetical protein
VAECRQVMGTPHAADVTMFAELPEVGIHPIVTSQYISATLYQVPYHIQ